MMVLRCTQKLLRRLSIQKPVEAPPSTTVLGDWYANLHHSRPEQFIVCMNARTLSVILLPARDSKSLGVRFRDSVANHLSLLGIAPARVEAEVQAMSEVYFGATASRSILGCLREAEFALSLELQRPRFESLSELELYFGEYIYSTNGYRQPRDVVRELFAAKSPGRGAFE